MSSWLVNRILLFYRPPIINRREIYAKTAQTKTGSFLRSFFTKKRQIRFQTNFFKKSTNICGKLAFRTRISVEKLVEIVENLDKSRVFIKNKNRPLWKTFLFFGAIFYYSGENLIIFLGVKARFLPDCF